MKEGAKGKREKGRKEMVKRQKRIERGRKKGGNCGRRGERENNLMNRKV